MKEKSADLTAIETVKACGTCVRFERSPTGDVAAAGARREGAEGRLLVDDLRGLRVRRAGRLGAGAFEGGKSMTLKAIGDEAVELAGLERGSNAPPPVVGREPRGLLGEQQAGSLPGELERSKSSTRLGRTGVLGG